VPGDTTPLPPIRTLLKKPFFDIRQLSRSDLKPKNPKNMHKTLFGGDQLSSLISSKKQKSHLTLKPSALQRLKNIEIPTKTESKKIKNYYN